MLINPIAEAGTSSFEFDTRDHAEQVACHMMRDGWDVMIRGDVVIADCPMHIITVTIGMCGLDY